MRNVSPTVAVVLLVLGAACCNGTAVRREPILHAASREELIALVGHNGEATKSLLDKKMTIEMREPGRPGGREFDANLRFARGGKLRLFIDIGLPGSPSMEVCTDGRMVWLRDDKGVVYRDEVNRLNRVARFAGRLLPRPEDLLAALALEPVDLGDPNAVVTVEEGVDRNESRWRQVYFLSLSERDPDLLVRKYVIDRTSLQVVRQIVYDEAGRVAINVSYGDLRKVAEGDLVLPHTIAMEWPQIDASLRLEFKEVRINSPVVPSVFDYPAGEELPDDYEFKPIPTARDLSR